MSYFRDHGPLGTTPSHGRDHNASLHHATHSHGIQAGRRRLSIGLHVDEPDGTQPASDDGFAWRYSTSPDVGWLYDFDINSADLKQAHRRYLDQTARKIQADPGKPWNVALQGQASRTGSESANQRLSNQRADGAFQYLKSQVPKSVVIIPYGVGESLASALGDQDGKEDMRFRAVLVSVWPTETSKPPPPPVPPVPDKPQTKKFMMRIVSGFSLGVSLPLTLGMSQEHIKFEIVDLEAKRIAAFEYLGASISASYIPKVSKLLPISASKYRVAAWTEFDVPRHWQLEKIVGPASMTSYGVSVEDKLSYTPTRFTFSYEEEGGHWYRKKLTSRTEAVSTRTWGTPSAGGSYGDGFFHPLGKPWPWDGHR